MRKYDMTIGVTDEGVQQIELSKFDKMIVLTNPEAIELAALLQRDASKDGRAEWWAAQDAGQRIGINAIRHVLTSFKTQLADIAKVVDQMLDKIKEDEP